MAHLSSSRCSFCGFEIGRKHFCCCLSCKSSILRTSCGISFPNGGAPTWDEFRSSYRCVKCDAGCSTNAACVNEGVVSDGVDGAAVGDGNVVAGGSRDGDDVEAIGACGESRPKRAVKRREILDPSHVSKRRKVHKAPEKPKSPSTCGESSPQHSSSPQTPQLNASPIGLLLVIGDLPFEAAIPVVAVQRRPYDSDGYRDEAPAEPFTESNFQVHHDGSNKGKINNATYTWRCSSCIAINACKAIVRQKKHKSRDFLVDFEQADFTEIPHDSDTKHNHAPDHGNHIREKFTAPQEILYGKIKKRKSIKGRDITISACEPDEKRTVFRCEVDFFPENVYQGPIYAGSATNRARHLLFFTPVMKGQLEDCRTWFIDATFHFVNDPIKQLLSINGFIKNSKGHLKQIPLLFCCITRRRAIDYAAVFQKLKV
ncbi:hypothetical protein GHT06_020560 [Daphnia sinensis]|uniref:MULE transposase domain-containing protein n=1 Tax=Daphnia sinensis TaxID=1820382 RepID=A0AAD5KZ49_9CRUS|nr:hypothetical protein GHT06_020560 [Daphnia sinensis]